MRASNRLPVEFLNPARALGSDAIERRKRVWREVQAANSLLSCRSTHASLAQIIAPREPGQPLDPGALRTWRRTIRRWAAGTRDIPGWVLCRLSSEMRRDARTLSDDHYAECEAMADALDRFADDDRREP